MSTKPDTWMICADTAFDHYQCGLKSSVNSYRFSEGEKHFQRALELVDQEEPSLLANVLIAYASLLVKLKRRQEAIAVYERRLALKRSPDEDHLERRCTAEHLAALKREETT
jgi:tetratricopeptide (TPR) repeat protein